MYLQLNTTRQRLAESLLSVTSMRRADDGTSNGNMTSSVADKVTLSAASLKKLELAAKKKEEQEKLQAAINAMREQHKAQQTQDRQQRKSLALQHVAELKQRLEMLEKMLIGLPPGAAKAIAAQLKQIAHELRQAVQAYVQAGSGQQENAGTTVTVQVNTPENSASVATTGNNNGSSSENSSTQQAQTEAAHAEQTATSANADVTAAAKETQQVSSSTKETSHRDETASTEKTTRSQNPDEKLDQAFRQLVNEVAKRIRTLAILLKNQLSQKERKELADELKKSFEDINELIKKMDKPDNSLSFNLVAPSNTSATVSQAAQASISSSEEHTATTGDAEGSASEPAVEVSVDTPSETSSN